MSHVVVFDVAAEADLAELYDYLSPRAGDQVASDYVGELIDYCVGFALFPERGVRRDDLSHGLRLVGYQRKATIAFRVEEKVVTIMRVLHRGRNFGGSELDDE